MEVNNYSYITCAAFPFCHMGQTATISSYSPQLLIVLCVCSILFDYEVKTDVETLAKHCADG